ncbi:phage-associated protein [Corynebacterium kutscheri]|nr:phage-associated protein [Corynebacterium kutscheri]
MEEDKPKVLFADAVSTSKTTILVGELAKILKGNMQETTSTVAEEGTAAHALGEHKIRRALNQRSQRPVSQYNDDDMEDYTNDYAEYVFER